MDNVTQKRLELMDSVQDFAIKCQGLYSREQALEMAKDTINGPKHLISLIETVINFVYDGGRVPA